MTSQQQERYHTILHNKPSVRQDLYKLVEELGEREDFRYLNLAKNKRSPPFVSLKSSNIRDHLKNVPGDEEQSLLGLILDHYYYPRGCRTIEVGFTTENNVVARPLVWYERVLGVSDRVESSFNELAIDLKELEIHTYTNDESIAIQLGLLNGVITQHKGEERTIDNRNISIKFAEYLIMRALVLPF